MHNSRHIIAWIFLLGALSITSAAQIVRVYGGSSDQYNSSGGSVEFGTTNLTSGLSLGTFNDTFRAGAFLRTSIRKTNFVIGDQTGEFELPTDLFGGRQQFALRGFSAERSSKSNELFIFAGSKSLAFGNPFARSASAEEAVGIISFRRRLNDQFTLVSRNLFSTEKTSIHGIEWHARDWLKLAVSGGIGSSEPYGAISGTAEYDRLKVKAAYIAQGENFRRTNFETLAVAEPTGGNLAVTWRPLRNLTTDYAHSKLMGWTSASSSIPATSVDSIGMNWNSSLIRVGGNFYTSKTQGIRNNAFAINGGRRVVHWLDVNASLLASRTEPDKKWLTSLVGTFHEYISPRLELLQLATHSNGNTTVSFGGNWLGNRVSFGLSYQTIYIPYLPAKPFAQAAVLNLRVRPFGNFQVHAGTAVGADGKVRYTAWAENLLIRSAGLGGRSEGMMVSMPKYIIRGQVTDEKSNPLRGVALRIGKQIVYSDDDGMFFVRLRDNKEVPLSFVFDEFLLPGYWEPMVLPPTAEPTLDENAPFVEVVLKRVSREQSLRLRQRDRTGKEVAVGQPGQSNR